jgi:mRNA interferase YafQ
VKQIRVASKFKKDFKKLSLSEKTAGTLKGVTDSLVSGEQLDEKFCDHPLSGSWKGYRDLHLEGDLLLIYKITRNELRLARIGSHSKLFR